MSLQERVFSVLLVSAAENFNASLRTLLPDFRFSPVCIEGSVSAAKRLLLERSFDFVLVNSPLPDDTGVRFAIDVCREKSTVVLVFVKSELYPELYERVSEHGVYALPKPASKSLVLQAVDWMMTTRAWMNRMKNKTVSIEEKMQEIRIVNRAKWLLIDHLKMDEAGAHRYIEKQAMDTCVSRREVAEDIIRTYS